MKTQNTKKPNYTILTQNRKIKETSILNNARVLSFNIPAAKTASGKVICPFAKDCLKYCYANKGSYKYKSVQKSYEYKYKLSKSEEFNAILQSEIYKERPTHIRLHDSGDFYSPEYLNKWLKLAEENKEIIFYAYTKSVSFFKGLELPQNFIIIFSEGGKSDNLINTETDRHARIFKTSEELTAAGYIDATKNDLNAIKENKKVGLLIH